MIPHGLARAARYCCAGFTVLLTAPAAVSSQATTAPATGWSTVTPGGETSCLYGSEYRFFTHAGNPAKVLLFLMGGGACWDGVSCVTELGTVPTAERSMDGIAGGVLDPAEPTNPFHDYTMVFAPYCSGDLHLGDNAARYSITLPDGTVRDTTVQHRGMTNGAAALAWIAANVPGAREIVVMGGSAGAIPTPVYGSLLARRFPGARVVALGDGGGAFQVAGSTMTGASWGLPAVVRRIPGWESFPSVWGVPDFSITAARATPSVALAQIDYAWDQVQGSYSVQLGVTTTELPLLLTQNRARIKAAVPGFRGFTLGGLHHAVVDGSDLHTHGSGGVWVRDWVGDLAAGKPVADVECLTCWRPELRFRPVDLALVDSVAMLLMTPDRWSATDAGSCRAQREQLSVRCAVARSGAVLPQAQAGSQAIFYAALGELGGRVPPLNPAQPFNPIRVLTTRPGTTHADVMQLLSTARRMVMDGQAEPRL